MTTLITYWPWVAALGLLVVYELVAVVTGMRTLSQMVWRAEQRAPWLVWVVLAVVGVLLAHFFFGLLAPDWATVAIVGTAKWMSIAAGVLVVVAIVLDIWGGEE